MLDCQSYITRKLNYGKLHPTCLTLSPHTAWDLIIGCKGGLLYVCDIRGKAIYRQHSTNNSDIYSPFLEKRGIIHKLRGHEEVVCLILCLCLICLC